MLVLEYSPERSWSHRQLFYVRGGLLARKTMRGRLEFREILGGQSVISAIHDFQPRMPWYLYRWTPGLVSFVGDETIRLLFEKKMRAFKRKTIERFLWRCCHKCSLLSCLALLVNKS